MFNVGTDSATVCRPYLTGDAPEEGTIPEYVFAINPETTTCAAYGGSSSFSLQPVGQTILNTGPFGISSDPDGTDASGFTLGTPDVLGGSDGGYLLTSRPKLEPNTWFEYSRPHENPATKEVWSPAEFMIYRGDPKVPYEVISETNPIQAGDYLELINRKDGVLYVETALSGWYQFAEVDSGVLMLGSTPKRRGIFRTQLQRTRALLQIIDIQPGRAQNPQAQIADVQPGDIHNQQSQVIDVQQERIQDPQAQIVNIETGPAQNLQAQMAGAQTDPTQNLQPVVLEAQIDPTQNLQPQTIAAQTDPIQNPQIQVIDTQINPTQNLQTQQNIPIDETVVQQPIPVDEPTNTNTGNIPGGQIRDPEARMSPAMYSRFLANPWLFNNLIKLPGGTAGVPQPWDGSANPFGPFTNPIEQTGLATVESATDGTNLIPLSFQQSPSAGTGNGGTTGANTSNKPGWGQRLRNLFNNKE
ncbi:hypothetical protein DRE_07253 [Drechslerella stenobrocha 248]|uniref:Uncharacterized protein n=1 Tax=Drechslerella stenobrocha 248 TaxID=1043628 RepID=W7HIW7_9PEZI|nr:hypothetical protein DRE_07253 [Drechslerella stenobrocha 248]